jgi:hypothetical protein
LAARTLGRQILIVKAGNEREIDTAFATRWKMLGLEHSLGSRIVTYAAAFAERRAGFLVRRFSLGAGGFFLAPAPAAMLCFSASIKLMTFAEGRAFGTSIRSRGVRDPG